MQKLAATALILAAAWTLDPGTGGAPSVEALPGGDQPGYVSPAPAAVPFAVGEEMSYRLQARWSLLRGNGQASLRVEAIDTVRGHPTYRLAMAMKGGHTVFKIDDVHRSWLDVNQLFSRRFEQKLNQTAYKRDRTYDFLTDEMRFVRVGNPDDAGDLASALPLDDVSFIYHLRTLPMVVGSDFTVPRYYKSEGNPVTIRVMRRERVTVPAGVFDAVVVQPIIRTDGLFSEGGQAELWISDDDRRLVLRLQAKVKIPTLTMELESYTPGR